jgi:hypothetical protein
METPFMEMMEVHIQDMETPYTAGRQIHKG